MVLLCTSTKSDIKYAQFLYENFYINKNDKSCFCGFSVIIL